MADARIHDRRPPGRRGTLGRLAAVWGPPLLYLGLIFWLSALAQPLGPVKVGRFDKVAHFVEYGLLGLLLARGFAGTLRAPTWGRVLGLGAGLAILYGLTDEFHQAFVPGRDADAWDLLADAFGATVGAGFWALRLRARATSGPERGEPSDEGSGEPSAG